MNSAIGRHGGSQPRQRRKGEGRIANLWTTSGLSRSLQECHGNPAPNSRMGLRSVDNCHVRHVGGRSVRAASCHQLVAPLACSCAVFVWRNCVTMAQVQEGAEAQVRDSGAGEQRWRNWRKPGTRRCGPPRRPSEDRTSGALPSRARCHPAGEPEHRRYTRSPSIRYPGRRELNCSSCLATVPTFKHSTEPPTPRRRRPSCAARGWRDLSRTTTAYPLRYGLPPGKIQGVRVQQSYQAREGTSGTKEKT